jgi:Trypsin-co-occurring domain 1
MPEQVVFLTYGDGEVLPLQAGDDSAGENDERDDSPFGADPQPVGLGDDAARLGRRVEESLDQIRRFGEMAIQRLVEAPRPPDKLTVQMQVKVTAEAGVVVARSTAEANFTITLEWARPRAT